MLFFSSLLWYIVFIYKQREDEAAEKDRQEELLRLADDEEAKVRNLVDNYC